METLNQDTEWVIQDMGVKGLTDYPKRNKTTRYTLTDQTILRVKLPN